MYSQVHFCPACNGKLLSQTNRHGQAFWFCERKPECKIQLSDDNEQPVFPKVIHRCSCGKGILLQKRGYQGKTFWGCSQYSVCKRTFNDQSGKPQV